MVRQEDTLVKLGTMTAVPTTGVKEREGSGWGSYIVIVFVVGAHDGRPGMKNEWCADVHNARAVIK